MVQTTLQEQQGDRAEGHLQESIPNDCRGESLHSQRLEFERQDSRHHRWASHGRGERAELEPVCPEAGRAGFRHAVAGSVVLGESEGRPRNAVSPDIYAEDFSAAVDFLGTRPFVDRERIGVLGICGSGSFVISAAKIDPRMKAIATVSMYDMGAANRNALHHSLPLEQRKAIIAQAAAQRYVEFTGGETQYTSGTVHELTADTDPIQREFLTSTVRRAANTPQGLVAEADYAPDVDQQREVHELLPVQ